MSLATKLFTARTLAGAGVLAPGRPDRVAGGLSDRWMDVFGENVYNLYGSTEVAWATIAGPADLRAAPGTAGRLFVDGRDDDSADGAAGRKA